MILVYAVFLTIHLCLMGFALIDISLGGSSMWASLGVNGFFAAMRIFNLLQEAKKYRFPDESFGIRWRIPHRPDYSKSF